VLLVCDQQGLLGHELFAIDGCKMRSNAAKEWSGTFKELKEKRQKLKNLRGGKGLLYAFATPRRSWGNQRGKLRISP